MSKSNEVDSLDLLGEACYNFSSIRILSSPCVLNFDMLCLF